MYLKQRDLKIGGSMADFTKRVVSHARGKTTQISESESRDSNGENSYVEESFEVLFVPEEDIQHAN